ncbi:MAG: hypothetical protein KDB19_16285, partial [Microthrixaceae bacterium]|nr:hypothetical protein [Microthrixaceae bacterium]
RVDLLGALAPYLARAYADLAGEAVEVGAEYESSWWGSEAGLAGTLAAARDEELRRRVTLVGPHRDEVAFSIGGLPARTHASQGEQRSLALALRLAAHRLVSDATGTPPVLLLDDVFSELDPARCDALVTHLLATGAQTIVTTAGATSSAIRTAGKACSRPRGQGIATRCCSPCLATVPAWSITTAGTGAATPRGEASSGASCAGRAKARV